LSWLLCGHKLSIYKNLLVLVIVAMIVFLRILGQN